MGLETIILGALFLVSAAVSYAGYQKAKKAARDAAAKRSGILYQTRAAAFPRRIVYGRARVGGYEAYVATSGTDNEYLHYILVWGEGPCESVESILFDGVEVPIDSSGDATGDFAGFVHVESKLGSPTQLSIDNAVSEVPGWEETDRLLGVCYSWIRLKYDQEKFPNGVPSISAVIQGRNDIFDPRDDSTSYTDNVALCMNHYMTLPVLGPGLNYSNEVDGDALEQAADDCDDAIDLSIGGTEPRYTFNGVVDLGDSAEDILEGFRTAMAGVSVYVGGKWRIYAGVYTTPTFTIEPRMLVGPVRMKTRNSKRDRLNSVRGIYCSEATTWQPTDFPAFTDGAYETADGEQLAEDLDLGNTNSPSMCRRIAKIALLRSRFQRQVSVQCNIEAYRAQPGRPLILNFPRLGFENVPMDVLTWDLAIQDNQIIISMDLKETSSTIFNWDEIADEDFADYEPGDVSALDRPISQNILGGADYEDLP